MARPKRDSRGYFNVTITIGRDATGKRIRKRLRSKTLAGLRTKQEAALAEKSQGKLTAGVKPMLKEFWPEWLEQVVKVENRPRTYERYECDVRNHLTPRIGRTRTDKLEHRTVQMWVNDLSASGLAPRSVRNAFICLRHSWKTVMLWKLATHNPCEGVVLPKTADPAIPVLSVEQARRLLVELRGHRLEALFWAALLLGMRQGELLALRWADIDFDAGMIQVQGSVQRQRLHRDAPKGQRSEMVFVPTKTKKGVRPLPLLHPLDAVLLAHKARQDEERNQQGWQENDLVFPSEIGTPLGASNLVNRVFKPALVAARLPDMPFHGLRHTTVSLLIASGVDPVTASAIAGHASASFTAAVYGHALPEPVKHAVQGLGALLGADLVLELPPKQAKRDR
jgi:integrase